MNARSWKIWLSVLVLGLAMIILFRDPPPDRASTDNPQDIPAADIPTPPAKPDVRASLEILDRSRLWGEKKSTMSDAASKDAGDPWTLIGTVRVADRWCVVANFEKRAEPTERFVAGQTLPDGAVIEEIMRDKILVREPEATEPTWRHITAVEQDHPAPAH